MSLIIIWIYFHCYYNGLQSMSAAALNSELTYAPKAFILHMSTWVEAWSGWRQLIQCIWGNASCEEYKNTVMWGSGIALGGRATWVTGAMYIPPSASVTCNESNPLPSRQPALFLNLKQLMRKETWKNLWFVFIDTEPQAHAVPSPLFFSPTPLSAH